MLKKILLSSLMITTLSAVGCNSMIPSTIQQQQNLALLQNQNWLMTHIGATEYQNATNARKAPSLLLNSSDMRVSGSDGCNRIMGNYALKDNQISFSPLATTRMACQNPIADTYKQALSKVAGYQVYATTLKLLDRHGNIVLQYQQATSAD